ncbi:MAG: XRE family transcriptional regulator [Zymomonas sp.]|jgi:transcriptional regulator with XRE-family HTH domain|nr:XRE family transcriptional regulator [Zymomonas sp.]MBA4044360.1 XRE family transcriptional regulator [Erythrobacter sp.]
MSAGIEELAASLREARIAKALTQKALGQRVGLPQSHISKIEKGAVDLKLSSLVEIARALELEIKLVPRKALPAVEGAVRAHGTSVQTSRTLSLLNQQAQIADRIKANFPDLLPQVEDFQKAIRSLPRLEFDAAQLKALDEALQPAKQLTVIIDGQGGVAALAKRLEEATSALRHFRNMQVHHAPLLEAARQRPAYRLEEDDG